MRLTSTVCALAAILIFAPPVARGAENARVGTQIDEFTLKSHFGKEYSLSDFAEYDAVVVAFVGAECPLAKLYAHRLAEMASELADSGVAFLGIDSNRQDSLEEIAAYAHRYNIEFPILKDPRNEVADQFGALRTPEVFLLDGERTIRYCGRIDDQYGYADGVGFQRPEPTRRDLLAAIHEILSGEQVSVPSTDVLGCIIGRVREPNEDSEITYSNQIARIFQDRCVECHREGRIGPFVMTSYEDVVGWGEMIREVVEQRRMPPWHAHPQHDGFANDLRLSDDEIHMISAWVENGCPEGDRSQLPEPREYVEGWTIGEPDQIVYMSDEPVDVPAEGVIDYYHFTVDPGWTEDKWIKLAEAKPESYETVHHILVFIREPSPDGGGFGRSGGGISGGGLIAGYAPGANAFLPENDSTAVYVRAGSQLVFQLHYTPNGSPQKDRSFVGFVFADPEEIEYEARSTAVANVLFAIPPGDDDYSVSAKTTFSRDTLVSSFTPHMHTRGKAFRYDVIYPDGSEETLLDVPGYDFNWQTTYHLKEPKLIPEGSTLLCTAVWDNSEDNLSNPDPTQVVTWGDQTWDEMMIGFYVEIFPKGQMPANDMRRRGGFGSIDADQILEAFDANEDGVLTKDELPGKMGQRIGLADQNGDGGVSKEELEALLKFFGRSRGGRRDRG